MAEADEFDRSFLKLAPIIAVITNIDAEHLDCYKDLDEIKNAFVEFANKVPFYGAIVACLDERGGAGHPAAAGEALHHLRPVAAGRAPGPGHRVQRHGDILHRASTGGGNWARSN